MDGTNRLFNICFFLSPQTSSDLLKDMNRLWNTIQNSCWQLTLKPITVVSLTKKNCWRRISVMKSYESVSVTKSTKVLRSPSPEHSFRSLCGCWGDTE